jgi:hypothetical protein
LRQVTVGLFGPLGHIGLVALLVGMVMCVAIRPASAQMNIPQAGKPSSLASGMPGGMKPPPLKPPQAAPAALPGAASRTDLVAPAQGTPIVDPTEALFDAINRGDIASARDAIDRGADLDGQSVLGMSPLDLSVDLGRNDITFLLLSLRNGDGRPRQNDSAQATKNGKAIKQASAHTQAGGKGLTSTKTATRASATSSIKSVAQVAPVGPRLFAGDGGTPNPGVGFLGFDNKH